MRLMLLVILAAVAATVLMFVALVRFVVVLWVLSGIVAAWLVDMVWYRTRHD